MFEILYEVRLDTKKLRLPEKSKVHKGEIKSKSQRGENE